MDYIRGVCIHGTSIFSVSNDGSLRWWTCEDPDDIFWQLKRAAEELAATTTTATSTTEGDGGDADGDDFDSDDEELQNLRERYSPMVSPAVSDDEDEDGDGDDSDLPPLRPLSPSVLFTKH